MLLSPAAAVLLLLPTALCFTSSPTNRNSVGNTVGLDNYSDSGASSNPLIPALNDASRSISTDQLLPSSPFGVIFDMDGTLIKHSINFAELRQRVHEVVEADPSFPMIENDYCAVDIPRRLTEEGQRRCNEIFADIEQRAVDNMQLQEGGAALVQFLIESGLKTAVLTRNLERNVVHMMELYNNEMSINNDETIFDPIVARNTKANPDDDEPLKSKPHPDGILHICKLWGCEPRDVIFVGDSANDDVSAANRAGCGGAVLLQQGGHQLDTNTGYGVGDSESEVMERTPSLYVESLWELKLCIEAALDEQKKADAAQAAASGNEDGYVFVTGSYSVTIPSIGVKDV